MPNLKSAKKRLRQSESRQTQGQAVRTKVKSYRRSFFEAIDSKDKDASTSAYKSYCSVLDKAAKAGQIKKNTAVRRKTRATEKLRALV